MLNNDFENEGHKDTVTWVHRAYKLPTIQSHNVAVSWYKERADTVSIDQHMANVISVRCMTLLLLLSFGLTLASHLPFYTISINDDMNRAILTLPFPI